MANYKDGVDKPLDRITGPLVGENLLSALKDAMLTQAVFKLMFGKTGEKIYTDKVPSYNDTNLPLIEFMWNGDHYENYDVYQTGTISGRIVLPVKLKGDYNALRRIALAFQRFLGSRACYLFDVVPGLIEFAAGIDFQYDKLLQCDGLTAPVIPFTFPVKFDLHLFAQKNPDIDLLGDLDADPIGWVTAYGFQVVSDEGTVLTAAPPLLSTGQTN
jgi:hypothetical protein